MIIKLLSVYCIKFTYEQIYVIIQLIQSIKLYNTLTIVELNQLISRTFYLRTNGKIAKNSPINHHCYSLKLFGYSGIANFHRGRHLNSIGLDFCTGKSFCLFPECNCCDMNKWLNFQNLALTRVLFRLFLIPPGKNSDPKLRPC